MKDKIIQGTPPMVFLPARNYVFRVSKENYIISIPRKGEYNEIAPDLFSKEDGKFNIYDENSGILYTPSITKVLFAASKYPDLKFNEFFAPYSIKINKDEVSIVGNIVEMLVATRTEGAVDEQENEETIQ